jgi:hypothetical protein
MGAKGLTGASLPKPPMIASTLLPPDDYKKLDDTVSKAIEGVTKELKGTFDTATGTLGGMARQLDEAARDKDFNNSLQPYIKDLRENSKTLAGAIGDSQQAAVKAAAAGHPASGLEMIAAAYEKWLKDGGLKDVLGYVTDYFKQPGAADALKEKAVSPTAITQPRATVDIQEMIIEIQAPAEATDATPDVDKKSQLQPPEDLLQVLKELFHDLEQRSVPLKHY